jgi:Cof subfamily protein (haloacid dehalogenase superfamily)
MHYKALFLDVDGTLIPYDYDALPSDVVCNAIQEAQKHVTICLVTGRGLGFVRPILNKLQIHSGYVVLNTGAVIVDLASDTVVHDQTLDKSEITQIMKLLKNETINFYLKTDIDGIAHKNGYFDAGTQFEKAYMLMTQEEHSEEIIDKILSQLSRFTSINAFKTVHKDSTKFGLNITHINATKLHGVQFLLEKLQIQREEVIGVGDSYNDFPLLMASGLKVAMGNAIDDLKAIADYTAPPVTEDGVATVINKFIFNK